MKRTIVIAYAALSGGCSSGNEAAPTAYVGLFGDNAVAVVDLASASVVAKIPVQAPDGLVITPDGAKVYVSSNSSNVVDVIDTQSNAITSSIVVGMQPAGLSITRDGAYVVSSVQGDGQVAVISTATDTVVGTTPVGKAHNSAISEDGAIAFVASQVATAPAVASIALPSAVAGTAYPLDKSPRALCELGGKLYVTVAGSDAIEVLDAATGQLGTPIATAGSPHDIRPNADGAAVLTISQTAGELEIYDPSSATIVAQIPTGTMPHWIGLAGERAYVTNEGDNNLAVIDLKSRSVVQTIAAGTAPRKIALRP